MGKVLKREELAKTAESLHAAKKSIVTTNGCFDLLHVGHVRILQAAKQFGNVLIVGINSDESTRKLKGSGRPIMPESERAEVLASLACVDYVTIFPESTPLEFVRAVKPNIHVKGSDYKASQLEEAAVVESFGGTLKILDLVPGKSTTSIVDRIRKVN